MNKILRIYLFLLSFLIKTIAISQVTISNKAFKNPDINIEFDKKIARNSTNSKQNIPIFYPKNELAFFCKLELKLEKKVLFPIKFRLGTVNYSNELEGK